MDPQRLTAIPLFAGLDSAQLDRIASVSSEEAYEIGRVLTQEADLSSHFFAILDGHVAVTTADGPVAMLGPGEVVGEIGALNRGQRSANVVAVTPVRALTMMAWDLRTLVDEIPALREGVEGTVAARLAELESRSGGAPGS